MIQQIQTPVARRAVMPRQETADVAVERHQDGSVTLSWLDREGWHSLDLPPAVVRRISSEE